MSRAVEFYLLDILIAHDRVKRYIAPFDNAQSLLHSELEWDATIRELEVIGEATRKLLKADLIEKEYQDIVDFRNHIVHGYFGIDEQIVWEVATNLLDEFINKIVSVIQSGRLEMDKAITSAQKDYHYSALTLAFLNTLSNKLSAKN
jgi:uncharacterized protein with HEPN domain